MDLKLDKSTYEKSEVQALIEEAKRQERMRIILKIDELLAPTNNA